MITIEVEDITGAIFSTCPYCDAEFMFFGLEDNLCMFCRKPRPLIKSIMNKAKIRTEWHRKEDDNY
jgi:hypothetical protein